FKKDFNGMMILDKKLSTGLMNISGANSAVSNYTFVNKFLNLPKVKLSWYAPFGNTGVILVIERVVTAEGAKTPISDTVLAGPLGPGSASFTPTSDKFSNLTNETIPVTLSVQISPSVAYFSCKFSTFASVENTVRIFY
ncbi:MAG: hypothetical protein ACOCUD_03510, partial [Bacillota bacterium]